MFAKRFTLKRDSFPLSAQAAGVSLISEMRVYRFPRRYALGKSHALAGKIVRGGCGQENRRAGRRATGCFPACNNSFLPRLVFCDPSVRSPRQNIIFFFAYGYTKAKGGAEQAGVCLRESCKEVNGMKALLERPRRLMAAVAVRRYHLERFSPLWGERATPSDLPKVTRPDKRATGRTHS